MKNLTIFGLAVASAAFAGAGTLWTMDTPDYQVATPEVAQCKAAATEQADLNVCMQTGGGWWFAYTGNTKEGQTYAFSPIDKNNDGTYKLITTDTADGTIMAGGNLQEDVGLVVTMTATGVDIDDAPAVIGIGFNFFKDDSKGLDVSSHQGFCLAYGWTGEAQLQAELSQGPRDETNSGYNTPYANLAPGAGKVAVLTWDKFKVDNWGTPLGTEKTAQDLGSFKIRFKNATSITQTGTLTVNQVGWAEDGCVAGQGGSAIGKASVASSAKATLSGRTLSFSGINSAATYEIVSLQGQVVKSGIVSSSVSLSSLNAGVYMVRVAGKSVNMNQKILVK